ncbi:hypothetical protein GCM10009730_29900 [Streptomyces albidochromogenes]
MGVRPKWPIWRSRAWSSRTWAPSEPLAISTLGAGGAGFGGVGTAGGREAVDPAGAVVAPLGAGGVHAGPCAGAAVAGRGPPAPVSVARALHPAVTAATATTVVTVHAVAARLRPPPRRFEPIPAPGVSSVSRE